MDTLQLMSRNLAETNLRTNNKLYCIIYGYKWSKIFHPIYRECISQEDFKRKRKAIEDKFNYPIIYTLFQEDFK